MTRWSEHRLLFDGAPCDSAGNRVRYRSNVVGGLGHAKCACGELSDPLPTITARRDWHRRHKADMT